MKHPFLLTILWLLFSTGSSLGADPALVIDSGGNTRYVRKVIFTRDGRQLVSVGDDRVIRVWDVKSGKTERTIRDQVGVCGDCRIFDIALSPDNKYLAAGGKFPGSTTEDRFAINIYDFATGERLQQLKGHRARVVTLEFSPESNQLASGCDYFETEDRADLDGPVRLWKLDSNGWQSSAKLGGHREAVSSLAFSPSGEQLASGSTDGNLVLWSLQTLPHVGKKLAKHTDAVFGLAFSPDGRFLVSGGLDRQLHQWDSKANFVKTIAELSSAIRSLDLSKDGSRILVGLEEGRARVLSFPEGDLIQSFSEDRDKVDTVAFSGVDKNLVASSGGFNGEIWLWNPETGKLSDNGLLAGTGQTIWSVGFAKDKNSIAFGTHHSTDTPNSYGRLEQVVRLKSLFRNFPPLRFLRSYELSLGGKLEEGDKRYDSALPRVGEYELRTRFGETLKRRVAGDLFISEPVRLNELLILRNGSPVSTIRRDSATGRSHLCFTFTPDGSYIISGGEGGYLALYDRQKPDKPLIEFQGHTNDVWSVATSPDGRFIVSGSSDQTIKLWDIKSEKYLLSVFVASDGEWIASTPHGYYTSSRSGDKYFGWQVEQPGSQRPSFYSAGQFRNIFFRPDVVSAYLETGDIQTALGESTKAEALSVKTPEDGTTKPKTVAAFWSRVISMNLPPRIEIRFPDNNLVSAKRLVNVKVVVTSTNLPITNVQISLNGVQKGIFRGSPEEKDQSRTVEMELAIALDGETNTLEVVASHAAATSSPQTRTIFYKPTPSPKGDTPQVPESAKRSTPNTSDGPESRKRHHVERRSYFSTVKHATEDASTKAGGCDLANTSKAKTNPPAPPTFEIYEPKSDAPSPLEIFVSTFILRVKLLSGGDNTMIRIRVNGEQRNFQQIQVGITLPFVVELESEGQYEVTVTAVSDGVESEPQKRVAKFRNFRPPKPNLIFLGIGVKGYKSLQPGLQYADKDVLDLASLLCRLRKSALFEDVKARVLLNEHVSRDKVYEELEIMNKSAVNENDIRIVLFSGHGGIHFDVGKYYFYVQDQAPERHPEIASPNWDTILATLFDRRNNVGRGSILLLVDTCRSGAASVNKFIKPDKYLVFMGASGADEMANENEKWGNGAFTEAVLEGLEGEADSTLGDRPKDGNVDAYELARWVSMRVTELNHSQSPEVLPIFSKPFMIATISPKGPANTTTNCPEVVNK